MPTDPRPLEHPDLVHLTAAELRVARVAADVIERFPPPWRDEVVAGNVAVARMQLQNLCEIALLRRDLAAARGQLRIVKSNADWRGLGWFGGANRCPVCHEPDYEDHDDTCPLGALEALAELLETPDAD